MINKNPEVGDAVRIHDVIFNDKNVLVSQKFAEAISRPVVLTELKEDYFKIEGFDEKLPKNWIRCIVGKHTTEEELDRARQIRNYLKQIDNSKVSKSCDRIESPVFWMLVSCFMVAIIIALSVIGGVWNFGTSFLFFGIGLSLIFDIGLAFCIFKWSNHLRNKFYNYAKEVYQDCIIKFGISYEDIIKLHLPFQFLDELFTEDEQEKGEKNLPYYIWEPTKLNLDDNKQKY